MTTPFSTVACSEEEVPPLSLVEFKIGGFTGAEVIGDAPIASS